jgi:L-rhamnono-1,4-lactonase
MASQSVSVPIIDSHIHLYPEAELDTLAWYTPDSPLGGRHSLEEFAQATGTPPNLRGFVFLETDRKNDESKHWTHPLQEIAWLRRIAMGQPKPDEGHTADDAKLCLGIIPWAPMNLGSEQLDKYLVAAEKEAGPAWPKVKGFRYLLQDKPNGTCLTDEFIESLKLLGKRGFVFDLGVDQHRRGRIQLEEAVDMIDRAHDNVPEDEKVVFILSKPRTEATSPHYAVCLFHLIRAIDHLCKPDLTIVNQTDPSFIAWRTAMFTLSKCSKTYMKLSGCFAEMPDSLKALFPWLAVVLAAFGPSRIMFASDWPVCIVGVDGSAWQKWRKVVERMCDIGSLSVEDQTMLWSGTAAKAYKLDV